ncbi:MAG: DUF2953 domain-containing protein [Clostridia bacterium]|nr:MAG: DUF2953 domain-containing protein [Clostridia bacterium]
MTALGFILGIAIFLFLLWFWPWRVELELRLAPGSPPWGRAWLAPGLYSGRGWQVELPAGLTAASLAENLSTWNQGRGRKRRRLRLRSLAWLTGLYRVLVTAVERVLVGVRIYHLEGRLRFGTGDAALTALLAGIIPGLGALAWQIPQRRGRQFRSRPDLQVSPDFNHTGLWLDLWCIFTLAPGHIISGILRVAGYFVRSHLRRRGVVLGQRQSSH